MRHWKLPLLICVIIQCTTWYTSHAQYAEDFVPGFVISLENDTIPGFVKIKNKSNVSLENLRYKENENGEIKILTPAKVKGFIIAGYTFLSRTTTIGDDFWLLEHEGPVRILEKRKSYNMMEYNHGRIGVGGVSVKFSYVSARKMPEPEKEDKVYKLLEKEGTGEGVVYNIRDKKINKELKRNLVDFFKDAPALSDVIAISDYQISDIPLMVYSYNEPQRYKLLPLKKQ